MSTLHGILRSLVAKFPRKPHCQRLSCLTGQLQDSEDLFRYTSGRWLWDETLRLKERYRRFNVAALQRVAASSDGAKRCLSMSKLAEGGFNKNFRLVMDNDIVAGSEDFDENADLWSSFSGLVSRERFVLNEDYDKALEVFAQLREDGPRVLEGEERAAFDRATSWATR